MRVTVTFTTPDQKEITTEAVVESLNPADLPELRKYATGEEVLLSELKEMLDRMLPAEERRRIEEEAELDGTIPVPMSSHESISTPVSQLDAWLLFLSELTRVFVPEAEVTFR